MRQPFEKRIMVEQFLRKRCSFHVDILLSSKFDFYLHIGMSLCAHLRCKEKWIVLTANGFSKMSWLWCLPDCLNLTKPVRSLLVACRSLNERQVTLIQLSHKSIAALAILPLKFRIVESTATPSLPLKFNKCQPLFGRKHWTNIIIW